MVGFMVSGRTEWHLNTAIKGVKPAFQGRSRQRRNELIDAGIQLLCDKGIADISIEELCTECGYSVGTFYSRFDDKISFFKAVQEAAVTEMLRLIDEGIGGEKWKSAPAEEIFARVVNHTIDILTSDIRGVVIESLIISRTSKTTWEPIRLCGRRMAEILIETLKDKFLEEDPETSRESILFGMQMFFGTLIQAILNDPGPVKLKDPLLRENLTRMLCLYARLKPENTP
ncbi:MAG: TetR/AcrR family transcriptional regulator [Sneathiella sp.]|nr:TetR/AcrR family transcriptional regulator [Sneathiella sp.]